MRNVVFATNISIDGYCDHTLFAPSEELMVFFTGLIQQADLLVYGRATYQLMVPYWPQVARDQSGTKAENEFARALTHTGKVVFSRTLAQAEGNTRIVRGDLEAEIRKLKQMPGKNISVGGVDLPSQLVALGLVDEFYFVVHPVLAGKGRRFPEGLDLAESLNLKLTDSRTFQSGAVGLRYLRQGW